MNIRIKRLRDSALIPKYWSDGAVGCDLHADLTEQITVWPHDSILISTGLSMVIPYGYGGFILPKSGLGHKQGLILGNSVGVIDQDYRGEIFISAYNRTGKHIKILPNQRIAQMVFKRVAIANFIEVDAIDDTTRGDKGFGSTDG